jgi:ubiquinone/menaquinone biosynthesis C-methylase UbiE
MIVLKENIAAAVSVDSAALFQRSWNSYKTLVRNNDLCHHDIVNAIRADLGSEVRTKSACLVLDLACGDLFVPLKVFSDPSLPVSMEKITGVDASRAALDYARSAIQLEANSVKSVELIEDEVMRFLESQQEKYDIVFVTFMLHHLSSEQKFLALQKIYSLMEKGGVLYYADVYNAVPGSDRDVVMDRWKERMQKYQNLTEEQINEIWEHVSTKDYPEEESVMKKMLDDCGFVDTKCIFKDDFCACSMRARKA